MGYQQVLQTRLIIRAGAWGHGRDHGDAEPRRKRRGGQECRQPWLYSQPSF